MFSYADYVAPFDRVLCEVKSRLEKANKALERQFGYAPIESIRVRVKSEESARKKLESKGVQFDEKNLVLVTDLAGIRVVCKFLDDLPEVVGLIKGWSSPRIVNKGAVFKFDKIDVVEETDYVSKPKSSGYRSLHLTCKMAELLFEVQVRTISMDFWATAEHLLKYKYSGDLPEEIREKLVSIADEGAGLDSSMNELRQALRVGTAKERLISQVNKAIGILGDSGQRFKAEKYKERLAIIGDNLDALKSLAIEAKEDVPRQYWHEE